VWDPSFFDTKKRYSVFDGFRAAESEARPGFEIGPGGSPWFR
jgi:hypothetical protein